MAKKRVNITITDETKERILQYAQENHLQGGLSGAIEHIAWQVLKVKNAQSKGQTSIKVDNKWHTVIKGTKTIDEYREKQRFMEQKAAEFYNKHKEAVEDWKEGEPVKVWFDFDMDNNLCIEYESGKCWHYNEKGEWW